MQRIRILSQNDTAELLDMESVIAAIENVYRMKSKKTGILFPMIFHEFESGKADMDIKSGMLKDDEIYGMKLVSWFGDNVNASLPSLFGTISIFDLNTGKPLSVMSGIHITGMRTGAAGAIGAKYLANKNSENLMVAGAGHQAAFQIAAHLTALENIKIVRICDPMSFENAKKVASGMKETLEQQFLSRYDMRSEQYERYKKKFDVTFEAVQDIEDAVKKSEIIVTVTPSKKPLIMKEWVQKGTHLSCVGADMSGKQEIDEKIFLAAKIFVDDMDQAISVGETEMAIIKSTIKPADICGEIGDLLCGKVSGRGSADDITIFDTTGIGLQDLAVAKLALNKAEKLNIGTVANL